MNFLLKCIHLITIIVLLMLAAMNTFIFKNFPEILGFSEPPETCLLRHKSNSATHSSSFEEKWFRNTPFCGATGSDIIPIGISGVDEKTGGTQHR